MVGSMTLRDPTGQPIADVVVPPPVSPPARDWATTAAGEQILLTLSEYGQPVAGPQLAELCGYVYTGSFRGTLLGLIGQGRILRDEHGFYSIPKPVNQ